MRTATDIVEELLNRKGISSPEDISEYLSDRPKRTYDPFSLLNMEAGVDLLLSEIKKGTRVCIYGDYDADGVTSTCILSAVLRQLTDNFTYYIPSRFDEGYGLNMEAIDRIHDDGAGLIVTVDCGSVSYEEVEHAKELGMKVIVTDHHNIDEVKADCILINPRQKGETYPYREIAGCGVAFKMAQAVQQRMDLPKKVINDVLDMVAIGTVSDVVELQDENRTFVKYGLMKINQGNSEAVRRLVKGIGLGHVDSGNIAFGIGPHINAAGRMKDAKLAVKLFTAKTDREIDEGVSRLIMLNAERKSKQEDAYKKALETDTSDDDFRIIYMEDIHEGIAGIVAGKLKEHFNRPVVIVTPSSDGTIKGTGRSIEGIDLYDVLKESADIFLSFGGHKAACGFRLRKEDLEKLRANVLGQMARLREEDPSVFEKRIHWDMEASCGEITMDLARELEKMEPFGKGNERPVFLLRGMEIRNVKFMGRDGTHARFTAADDSGRIGCVLFRKAIELKEELLSGERHDITGTVEVQEWQGQRRLQFIVEEIK